jgi:hypothetical protein
MKPRLHDQCAIRKSSRSVQSGGACGWCGHAVLAFQGLLELGVQQIQFSSTMWHTAALGPSLAS